MKLLKLFTIVNILFYFNVLAEDYSCTGGDKNLTIAPISIDGVMDDWAMSLEILIMEPAIQVIKRIMISIVQ